jgi:hypothetical protein
MVTTLALTLPRPAATAGFNCAGGDVAYLIDSINMSNANGETNTITLGAGTYTVKEVNNITPDGPHGLPAITSPLTIIGDRTTPTIIERPADAPHFRLVYIALAGTLTLASLILRGAGISNDGTLTFAISTLSGGGGITNDGWLSIVNSTLSGGGGINNDGWVVLQNTILVFGNGDCDRSVISLGHYLIGGATGCPIIVSRSDLIGPHGLGPFTDNGIPGNGRFPLLPDSLAIDSGDNSACLPTDQLWHPRVGVCDIGAIDFPSAP